MIVLPIVSGAIPQSRSDRGDGHRLGGGFAVGKLGGIGRRHCRRDFVYCNLSVKIGCLLQLQQAVDKVDHQPKGGQQTHGGQYKKNLISIAQGGQRHQREQGTHRQLYPADHSL